MNAANKMNKQYIETRIEKLKTIINKYRYDYHVLNKATVSEEALDSLKHELKQLEDENPDLVTVDSPTQRVAGEPLRGFKKIKHSQAMLSIEDIFSKGELKSWEDYLKRLTNIKFSYFCEVKVDGLALALRYKNGSLNTAITRGNGQVGEDVTQNAKTIESIPLNLKLFENLTETSLQKRLEETIKNDLIEIRGEVYISKKDFEKLNKERKKTNEEPYANPRNLAAGSMRQLDSKITSSRPISFLAYDIVTSKSLQFKTHSSEHAVLNALGFKTDTTAKKCETSKDILNYWNTIEEKRKSIEYQIDGVVISINENNIFDNLGVAGKSPRAIRAFKFSPKQTTTIVEDVKIHVGKTGAITPVAVLKPVNIGGVTVSRASLHNFDEIERLDVRVGDTVIVERAGDVIPKVIKVLKNMRSGNTKKIKPPKYCPQCKTRLIKKRDEVIWKCQNSKCESRKQEHVTFFVSRGAFDIDGFGPKVVKQLWSNSLISDPADIFTLEAGDLEQLDRFAEKSAQNLINAIENSKKIDLYRFIIALNIFHIGEETAIDLAQKFGNFNAIQKATEEDFKKIYGIGEVTAKELADWFSKKENLEFIQRLFAAGVRILSPKKQGKKLNGQTFVFTGSIKKFSRDDAEFIVRDLGGSSSGVVSKNTDYVVAGSNPGSKFEKAKKLGIKIISEKEFKELIK